MKNKTIITIVSLLLLSAVSAVFAEAIKKAAYIVPLTNQKIEVAAGSIIVKFRKGTDRSAMSLVNRGLGCVKKAEIRNTGIQKIRIPEGSSINDIIEQYKNNPNVEHAEPNYIRKAFLEPNDPEYILDKQWGLHDDTNNNDIDAPTAWDIETGTSTVIIAVIDSGIHYDHEDLADNMWQNAGEMGGGKENNSIDDDGNGYVDDHRGWYFDPEGNDTNDPMDVADHGTGVAGAIAAVGNNGKGITGVAWNAKIMNLRIMDSLGNAGTFALVEAMYYAADNGADIINLSLGGIEYPPQVSVLERNAISSVTARGCLVIAATGNAYTLETQYVGYPMISYPAGYSSTLAVGACNKEGERSSYSNSGTGIDVVAPGGELSSNNGIYTTTFISSTTLNSYGYAAGTSLATPIVSGLAALMISYFGDTYEVSELKDIIRSSCVDIDVAGYDIYTGYGRVNARGALASYRPTVTRTLQAGNYKNPFIPAQHGTTTIFFTADSDTTPRRLTIFTMTGDRVFRTNDINQAEILKEGQRLYEYEWNGKNEAGIDVAGGIYIYVIETSNASKSGKIALIR